MARPQTSDAVSQIRASIADIADTLDVAALALQGLLADRPASTVGTPGIQGRLYFATDTQDLYYDAGTSWVNVTDAAQQTLFDAKGDILAATADNTPARLAVGPDGRVLVADAAQSAGVKWGQVPTVGIADEAVTLAKIAAAVPAIVAASGGRRTFKPFAVTKPAVAGTGWQTLTVPYGFTMSAVDVALAIPAPQTNGSSLAGWSLSGFGTSSMAFFVNNVTLQDIIFYGFVIGTPA
jgi:hypothetical protein